MSLKHICSGQEGDGGRELDVHLENRGSIKQDDSRQTAVSSAGQSAKSRKLEKGDKALIAACMHVAWQGT